MDEPEYLHLQCNGKLVNVHETPEWSRETNLLCFKLLARVSYISEVNAYYKYRLRGLLSAVLELIILHAILVQLH